LAKAELIASTRKTGEIKNILVGFMDFLKDYHHKSKQKQTHYEKINPNTRNSYKPCNNY